ncbi:thioesterase family protein [Nocardioides sp. MAHUQ-72]|uniref:thioesterase family protein n=1 Tax=unclassified Nocardioides TaxID=2615069 RepID=UPI00361B78B0
MEEKSGEHPWFYRLIDASGDGRETFESLPATAGPWAADAQHGGPPAALLARAVERLSQAHVGRFTMELHGPVPVGPLATSATVLRPGRSVQLVGAELHDVTRGRVVASARAWLFPVSTDGPEQPKPLAHGPADGVRHDRPTAWHGGYLDAVEWRWVSGSVSTPGPGVVWMRPPALVEGEHPSPVQRLLACADSASGASAALDVRRWAFLNTELTVHVLRPPVGEWICLDAETTLGPGSVGVATAAISDELGLVARSSQALLVAPR